MTRPEHATPSPAGATPKRHRARPGRPRKDQEQVTLRLDRELLARMRAWAQDDHRTLDSCINSAIGYFFHTPTYPVCKGCGGEDMEYRDFPQEDEPSAD